MHTIIIWLKCYQNQFGKSKELTLRIIPMLLKQWEDCAFEVSGLF